MNKNFLKELFANARPFTKLFFALFIIFASYILLSLLSFLIILPIYSISFEEFNTIIKEGFSEADLSLLRVFQISQSIGLFIIPAVVLNFLLFPYNEGFINNKIFGSFFIHLIILLSVVFSMPIVNFLMDWNSSLEFPQWLSFIEDKLQQMELERNQLTHIMTDNMQLSDYFFNLLMIAVLPAIGEEFIFRGVLQKIFQQWTKNPHISILIAAIIFSSIHLQFYGFFPRLVLGIYFGYLFFWSKNIWLAVLAHFLNNALAISFIFLSDRGKINIPSALKDYNNNGFIEVILSISITSILLLITYRYFKKIFL